MSYTYESPLMASDSPIINYRKDAKKGIKFTFMLVGELGTGKTTFVNSLLNKKVLNHRFESSNFKAGGSLDTKTISFTNAKSVALPNTAILTRSEFNPETANEEPGIALTETKVELVDDDNVKLQLTVIDTPGFGENLNNEICFVEIENYLKQQFDLVLAEETRIRRNPRFVDTRVHVLLYFITPTGHGLREIDITCMKKLSKYVNVIPVIGKADTFTQQELKQFKSQIRTDIEKFNIPIFQFDSFIEDYDEDEDFDLIEQCKYLSNLVPFAIISSEDEYEITDPRSGESKVIKARKYPWGLIDVNNPAFSDFPVLKSVLFGSHLQDLKDLTHDFLYETYRTERLTKVTGSTNQDEKEDEFHDTSDYPNGSFAKESAIPSLSNLAQIANITLPHQPGTSTTSQKSFNTANDTESVETTTSGTSKKSRSMVDVDTKENESFSSSLSTISASNGNNKGESNASFKRFSIAPQRNQLRQISETVPYVIRHERIVERQHKLEEMEMASAKELASRAAALEKKAQELKAKEKSLLKRLEDERQRKELVKQSSTGPSSESVNYENATIGEEDDNDIPSPTIRKDETLTDLHKIASS